MQPWIVGIDVGARETRAVVLDPDRDVAGRAATITGAFFARAADEALAAALRDAGIERSDVNYVASTGYGRAQVAFRDLQITEITCHATGALALVPTTRTVIDIGAQNTRVIATTSTGRVARFRVNDKCAAGAGRFLERVAAALDVGAADIGTLALGAAQAQTISSVCAVLAESEVINLVSQDLRTDEILLGAHHSITDRVVTLVRQVNMEPDVTLTGGLVHNAAMVRTLEEKLGTHVNAPPDGEFAGAIGAALLGRLRYERRRAHGETASVLASTAPSTLGGAA